MVGLSGLMANEKIIRFDTAKKPHEFNRREKKVADIKNAFKASRQQNAPQKPKKPRRKRKKK